MELQEGKWSYNRPNDEVWNCGLFDTREEAVKEAIWYGKEYGYKEMEVGVCTLLPLPCYVDIDDILENLNQQYEEDAGEIYDDDLYSDVVKEDSDWLEEELSKVIHEFHKRAGVKSKWYTVANIQRVKVE